MKIRTLISSGFLFLSACASVSALPNSGINRSTDYMIGKTQYESFAIIEFGAPRIVAGVPEEQQIRGAEHLAAQRADLLSPEYLNEVIGQLIPEADERHDEFLEQAKKGLKVESIKNTDLYRITMRFPDSRFSRDFVSKLTEHYLKLHKPTNGERIAIVHEEPKVGAAVKNKNKEG